MYIAAILKSLMMLNVNMKHQKCIVKKNIEGKEGEMPICKLISHTGEDPEI